MIKKNNVFSEIETLVGSFDFEEITTERKNILQPLIDFIQQKVDQQREIRLNLICTHNSRRSHLSQVWAQTAAYFYDVKNVFCYSGGTEATALFPKVIETLEKSGFQIQKLSEENNPVYVIKFAENQAPVIGFSKTHDSDFNPKTDFAAILTCSQADSGCPFIAGAEKRIPITFDDPKLFDNTPSKLKNIKKGAIKLLQKCFMFFLK